MININKILHFKLHDLVPHNFLQEIAIIALDLIIGSNGSNNGPITIREVIELSKYIYQNI